MVIRALLVLAGGGLGAIARFLVDGAVEGSRRSEYPFGTLVVNATGTFVLGLLVGAGASHRAITLLGTATLGSYTTFSTWMLETHRSVQDGEPWLAWLNVAVSVLLGLAAVALGRTAGGAL